MLSTFDSEYWEQRFNETFGYLLYRETFSFRDVVNARYRYGREIDDRMAGVITNRRGKLSTEEMWAAIVAPVDTFWSDDWRKYTKKGMNYREKALIKLLTSPKFPKDMDEEEIIKAKAAASTELLNSGFYVPLNHRVVPDRLPMKVDYTDYRLDMKEET